MSNKFKSIKEYKNKKGKTLFMFKIYLGMNLLTGRRMKTTRRGFKTKTAEKDAYTRMKADALNGSITTSTQKYEDIYNKWIISYQKEVKHSTLKKNKTAIQKSYYSFIRTYQNQRNQF